MPGQGEQAELPTLAPVMGIGDRCRPGAAPAAGPCAFRAWQRELAGLGCSDLQRFNPLSLSLKMSRFSQLWGPGAPASEKRPIFPC